MAVPASAVLIWTLIAQGHLLIHQTLRHSRIQPICEGALCRSTMPMMRETGGALARCHQARLEVQQRAMVRRSRCPISRSSKARRKLRYRQPGLRNPGHSLSQIHIPSRQAQTDVATLLVPSTTSRHLASQRMKRGRMSCQCHRPTICNHQRGICSEGRQRLHRCGAAARSL